MILNAADQKIGKVDSRLSKLESRLLKLETKMHQKLEAMEERWSQKFDKLTNAVNKFLKRMTDMED